MKCDRTDITVETKYTQLLSLQGYTALMEAALRGYDEIVEILLKSKANAELKDVVSVSMCCS